MKKYYKNKEKKLDNKILTKYNKIVISQIQLK